MRQYRHRQAAGANDGPMSLSSPVTSCHTTVALSAWLATTVIWSASAGAQTAAPSAGDREVAAWGQFRGPQRSGVSAETGLLREWPADGPRQIWRRTVGGGYSGVSVAGERFFTLFADADKEYLGAFRVADGVELWRREIDDEVFTDEFGRGPRATPTVAGEWIYALSGRGNLVAVEAASGKAGWQVDLFREYGFFGPQWSLRAAPPGKLQLPSWGYSYSPLVEGDLIIAETGTGKGKSYVALDRFTGEPRWSALDHPIGYGSPLAATLAGRRQIIAVADTELVSLSPEGDVFWRLPWAPTIGQPLFLPPDRIFVTTVSLAHLEGGAMVVRVKEDGGALTAEPVWRSSILKSLWSTPVHYLDHIFGFDNATLRCLRAADGESMWAHRGLGKGNLIAADGLLFIYNDRGTIYLAAADPAGYRETGRARIIDGARTWTPPTLAGGRLYLRGGDEIVSLAVDG